MLGDNIFIHIKDVSFGYGSDSYKVLSNVNLDVCCGEFLVILGENGAGKSTFLKLLNALLLPSSGSVFIDGCNTKDKLKLYEIRSKVGMILQNPENQIVNSIVEEDVAFGPENLGIPTDEIQLRVTDALKAVGMLEYSNSLVCELSGGQKQRVAIAGALAMCPRCLLLDEATSMIDERSKREILEIVVNLNKKKKITVIMITHDAEEIVYADRIVVFEKGKIKLITNPKELFYNDDILSEVNINKPNLIRFSDELLKFGIKLPSGIFSKKEFAAALEELIKNS